MKNNINKYLKLALIILLGLALIYFAIKVVIFWLPLIIILIIIYCIYKFFIKKNKQAEDINKSKTNSRIDNSSIEAQVINEKFDD